MFSQVLRRLRPFARDRRGNVAMITAFALPLMVGSLGLGAEVTSWYNGKRALQSAADSAAVAAASNSSDNFASEARAVAAQYGYRDGQNGISVAATQNVNCPGGQGPRCFKVTISKIQPLILAQIVGFDGDAQYQGQPAKRLLASATAIRADSPRDYCILALAESGANDGIRSNGAPDADLTGCKVMSNTDANCNGHSLKADFGDAHGHSDNCGKVNTSNVPVVSDPYAGLAGNVPANSCGAPDYSWIPAKKHDPALAANHKFHGTESRTLIKVCGDALLDGDTVISGGDTLMVIYGGQLNVGSFKLSTASGSKLTVVFAGPHFTNRSHIPTGTGMFDIQAPQTGIWKGVSFYQVPSLTQGVDLTEAGNSPAWKITGLAYMPHASVTFSGVVNKASYGDSCFGMVVDNLRVNGTAQILAHGECPRAGLILPTAMLPGRGQLVS